MADFTPLIKKSLLKMVAILNARVKGIMKSGIALSPKFGFQLMAKSGRAIQPTVYSNKPDCQSEVGRQ